MKRFFKLSNARLAFEVLLVITVLAALLSHSLATRAASPQAPDALYWYQCNGPNNHVAVFTDRVHIYCDTTTPISGAPPIAAVHWFAVSTSGDSAAASRFMSLLQTSVITARVIWVQVDPNDTSGTSFGCGSGDCRKMYGMEMR